MTIATIEIMHPIVNEMKMKFPLETENLPKIGSQCLVKSHKNGTKGKKIICIPPPRWRLLLGGDKFS